MTEGGQVESEMGWPRGRDSEVVMVTEMVMPACDGVLWLLCGEL